jgi:chromate reductase, NAD(P)H dehydrogenase (quinone)
MTPINAIMSRIITVQNHSMKKILAFSGSFSIDSINQQLIVHATELLEDADVSIIRLSDYEAPIYRKELELKLGIPPSIQELKLLFDEADGFLISTPEYNSSIPSGLKNTLDWISRMEGKIFQDKPVLLMSASPGGRGGQSVLNHLRGVLPFWGAQLVGTFSLPKFGENFSEGRIINSELAETLIDRIKELSSKLEQS